MSSATRKKTSQHPNLIKALSFPLRARIFRIISEREASPSEIAREMDHDLSNTCHHINVLVELGCAKEVRTEQRRGFIEHFYRAIEKPWVDGTEWDGTPKEIRQSFLGEIVEMEIADRRAALEGGTIGGDSNFVLARDRYLVDEEGYTRIREIMDQALKDVAEEEGKSAERRAGSDDEGVHMAISLACFKVPADS